MIAIINTSSEDMPKGECTYRLQINDELIARFTHYRPDGLGMCLRRAADAADRAKAERFEEIISVLRAEGAGNGEVTEVEQNHKKGNAEHG